MDNSRGTQTRRAECIVRSTASTSGAACANREDMNHTLNNCCVCVSTLPRLVAYDAHAPKVASLSFALPNCTAIVKASKAPKEYRLRHSYGVHTYMCCRGSSDETQEHEQ